MAPAASADEVPELPERVVYPEADAPAIGETGPSPFAPPRVLNIEAAVQPSQRLDEAIVDEGWAQWDAGNSLGMAMGLQIRGFALSNQGASQLQASRPLLNGHADIAWRFARDPATVQSMQLIAGHDATLYGAGTPGGTLMVRSKAPTGAPFTRLQTGLQSHGGFGLSLDAERALGPLQLRAVLSSQSGNQRVDGLIDKRMAALLSTRLPLQAGGHLQLDLEHTRNQTPFSFGTAYAAGRFWLDQSYVDTQRASADRRYNRIALYWQQPLGNAVQIKAHLQHARAQRHETLLGFWDVNPKNPSQLRGYYRIIDESYRQHDAGIQLDGQFTALDMQHAWALSWLQHQQARDFAGPQNVAGFILDVQNPVFPTHLQSLPLTPRYTFETYRESGLGAAWQTRSGPWEWRIGLRKTQLQADISNNPATPQAPAAKAQPLSHGLGISRSLGNTHKLWLSRAQSFMPNRGQFADGQWLPASRSVQWEIGWAWQPTPSAKPRLSLALFDLRQSNLPASDPANPDAWILLGALRSQGLETRSTWQTGPLQWSAAFTLMNARVQTPTSPNQGRYLPGVADRFGSLRIEPSQPSDGGLRPWARIRASAPMPGNSKASFYAPGYAVLDLGVQGQWPQRNIRWSAELGNAFNRSYVRALTTANNVWQGPKRELRLGVDMDW